VLQVSRRASPVSGSKIHVKGSYLGVAFRDRGTSDPNQIIVLYVDDGWLWHEKLAMSAYWIDDAIKVLSRAKKELDRRFERDHINLGWCRRTKRGGTRA
jgi:hypothetical protein